MTRCGLRTNASLFVPSRLIFAYVSFQEKANVRRICWRKDLQTKTTVFLDDGYVKSLSSSSIVRSRPCDKLRLKILAGKVAGKEQNYWSSDLLVVICVDTRSMYTTSYVYVIEIELTINSVLAISVLGSSHFVKCNQIFIILSHFLYCIAYCIEFLYVSTHEKTIARACRTWLVRGKNTIDANPAWNISFVAVPIPPCSAGLWTARILFPTTYDNNPETRSQGRAILHSFRSTRSDTTNISLFCFYFWYGEIQIRFT